MAKPEGLVTTRVHKHVLRVALTCVACDIPACRKVTGFLGHHASLACSKCLKTFPVSFGKPINYSGFDRDNWIMRTSALHRQHCVEICDATTKTGTKNWNLNMGYTTQFYLLYLTLTLCGLVSSTLCIISILAQANMLSKLG